MKIIHVVGPSFRDNINDTTIQNDNYMRYLSYDIFDKIYNDIFFSYKINKINKNDTSKLLLVPISSGQFATFAISRRRSLCSSDCT